MIAFPGHVKVNTLCWCIEYVHRPRLPALWCRCFSSLITLAQGQGSEVLVVVL